MDSALLVQQAYGLNDVESVLSAKLSKQVLHKKHNLKQKKAGQGLADAFKTGWIRVEDAPI